MSLGVDPLEQYIKHLERLIQVGLSSQVIKANKYCNPNAAQLHEKKELFVQIRSARTLQFLEQAIKDCENNQVGKLNYGEIKDDIDHIRPLLKM